MISRSASNSYYSTFYGILAVSVMETFKKYLCAGIDNSRHSLLSKETHFSIQVKEYDKKWLTLCSDNQESLQDWQECLQ